MKSRAGRVRRDHSKKHPAMTSEKPDACPRPAPTEALFQSTCWSVVLDLDASDPARARTALEELCRAYWPPLYAFARRKGLAPHDAQDLVQGFFLALCAEDDFRKYVRHPDARFRTWLLSCLRRFEIDEWRKQQTLKIGRASCRERVCLYV